MTRYNRDHKVWHSLLVAGVMVAGLSGSLYADETPTPPEPTKLDKALDGYTRTGEMKRCLSPSRIRQTRVVDDNNIIFEVSGREKYLNTLPHKCSSLGFHEAIAYEVRGGFLCSGDIFRVIDSTPIPGPSCQFGQYEKLEKTVADAGDGATAPDSAQDAE
ncbi:hypothetical protein [Kordiimonas pumila]|uniref:Uncharacterized protein n=1 Tax=Kordiimonas pumila TaxID=2161677 RepID=A0ABV7D451_9PROT|nr:hypothetical protein [Kordiimonas pumila]